MAEILLSYNQELDRNNQNPPFILPVLPKPEIKTELDSPKQISSVASSTQKLDHPSSSFCLVL